MHSQIVYIKMLGSLELEYHGEAITDKDNRAKKIWLLLALLVYNRNSKVPSDKIFSYFGDEFKGSSNPQNALKTLFHRLRVLLTPLGKEVSQDLFLSKKGEYFLNPDFPYELDIDRFEALVQSARKEMDPVRRSEVLRQALDLYRGDFLTKFSDESWIVPISTYYHNLFIEAAESLLSIYESGQDYQSALDLLKIVHSIDPYEERFYLHQMQILIIQGRLDDILKLYQQLTDMLHHNFGTKPSPEIKKLYRKATIECQNTTIDSTTIQKHLMETALTQKGALYFDYDSFANLYQAMVNGLERTHMDLQLIVLTITDYNDSPLSKRSLSICIGRLKDLLRESLRKGDIISMCSPTQLLILFPNATFDNAVMVTQRIEKAFFSRYPHSPAKLSFEIQSVFAPSKSQYI